jgi:hypothetical protein
MSVAATRRRLYTQENWKGSTRKETGRNDYISDGVKQGNKAEKAKVGSRRAMRDGVRESGRGAGEVSSEDWPGWSAEP